MTNDGNIRDAVERVVFYREKSNPVDEQYEWTVRIEVAEGLSYGVFIKEKIFKQFESMNMPRADQINTLMMYLFNVIAQNILDEIPVDVRQTFPL